MEIIVWAAHVLLAIVLVVLVLLQHGKGADMGAAFGSGSAGSLFGASGSASFLSRATGFVAAMFFATSMSLTYLSVNQTESSTSVMSLMDQAEESENASEVGAEKKSIPDHDQNGPEAESGSKVNQIPE
ncbi:MULTISPECIES: preprotein translocase subunit SecG [Nitrosomonas]|uniref:Protein-export membrane protein SecG n=1 Tax=Nitrosomonas oligotropha TaxID=42354 RepID=A0A1H8QVT6_9PROT|nr:preprotein translocase subunit SecG [Nitrosomonas oligotropha]MBK7493703.1 preprotein translocase subunit SecG [Nitrosomonas sp.]PTQ72788.1 protein translocase subunit secG [Nitrosomonas oligotropha]SDW89329.1 protein translocase subunit secG [Nitrosomonas oligotropha]SEO58048.1 protein translocase subunit secG [Nitrosomonas oligotropha]